MQHHPVDRCNNNLLSLHQCGREPVQTFVESVTGGRATRLNVPLTVGRAETVQSELVGHFCGTHSVGEILLVGKDEEHGVAQFVFVEHTVQFVAGGVDTVRVVRVYDKDETLGVLVIVAPEGADLVLTTHIPDCKGNVLVLYGFHVKSNGRDGGDDCGWRGS